MAAAVARSSARVSPRSVIRVCGDLGHDLLDRRGGRLDAARDGQVAHRAEANGGLEDLLARHQVDVLGGRVEHPVAAEDPALVREVDRRQLDVLAGDVLPDVELGPVRDREDAHVLALADPAVVDVPQLRALVLRVPLAVLVAEREDALLGPRALLVAPRAAERGVEAVLGDRVEQRRGLQAVARCGAGRSRRPRGRRRSSPARGRRSGGRRAPRRAGRGTRSPRGSCGPCPRA